MLETILGNQNTAIILLKIYGQGQVWASGLSNELKKPVRIFQYQLERLETGGVLVSRKMGSIRLFEFNPQSPMVKVLKELIKIQYDLLSDEDRKFLFQQKRARPRKRGKIINSKG